MQSGRLKIYKRPLFKKKLRLSIILLIMVALIYSIYWFFHANLIEDKFRKFSSSIGDWAIYLSFESINISGFPYSFSVNLINPILTFGLSNGPNRNEKSLELTNNLISVKISPWNYRIYNINFGEKHNFDFFNNNKHSSFRGITEKFNINLVFDHIFDTFELDFDIAKLKFQTKNLVTLFSAKNLIVSVSEQNKQPAPNNNGEIKSNYNIFIRSEGFAISEIFNLPVSQVIELISAKIKIFGYLNTPINAKNIEYWRENGGIIEIEEFEIVDAKFKSTLNGTVSLDNNLQILAAFVAEVEGLPFVIKSLYDNSRISAGIAEKLNFLLDLISKTSPNGARKNSFPITIQDRELFIGRTPLVELPTISW